MEHSPIFIVTGADIEPRKERYIEYMLSLHKIFSYGFPVYGVVSEHIKDKDNTPFSQLPFKKLTFIEKGNLDTFNKSPREFISIKCLLDEIQDLDIDDSTFVIKASGRYLILDDSFISLVKSNQLNPNVNSIIRLCDNDTQQYTFLYALRYKYFKAFYSQDHSILANDKNIEQATLEFLHANNLFETTLKVDRLGILTNINGEGAFRIF